MADQNSVRDQNIAGSSPGTLPYFLSPPSLPPSPPPPMDQQEERKDVVRLTHEPLNISECVDVVRSDHAGAISSFIGKSSL